MKKISLLLFFLISMAAGAMAQSDTGKKMPHNVVFHLSSGDTLAYRALVKQLDNMTKYWDGQVHIVVVMHNKGIDIMKKGVSNVSSELTKLAKWGVSFRVCQFTMKNQNLSPEDMLPEAGYVFSGLQEVVTLQEQGYSYIKAGF
jgi:intracellular sulfur oxidation DsrE/DsrF family protein